MKIAHRFHLVEIFRHLAIVSALALASGTSLAQTNAERPLSGLSAWDTGLASPGPLSPESIERKHGWRPIAGTESTRAFEGDAVIANGRILSVARKLGVGIELYSLKSGTPIYRTR